MSYGTSAPFLATRVLKDLALKNISVFPLTSEALMKQCYVDDILSGCDRLEDLEKLYNQLNTLLNTFGFTLHKWYSNSLEFMNHISAEKFCEYEFKSYNSSNKVLGLKWRTNFDQFEVSIPNYPLSTSIIKRNILSHIVQCFDPLGLLSPVIVTGKLIMLQIWRLKLDWDALITDESILFE